MPILDNIRDGVARIFPPKEHVSKPQGVGYSNGGARSVDDNMIISKPAIVAHTSQAFFSFLAMACFASVASFEAKWKIGPSGISGFAIFVAVTDLVLSLVLLLTPVIWEKYDRLNRFARLLKEDRVTFILVGWGAATMFLIAFISIISAFTQAGCKDPNKDSNAKLGDDFKKGLSGFCDTKKAGSIFFWFATIAWFVTAYLTFKDWRSGKRSLGPRDPPFTHPDDPSGYAPTLGSNPPQRVEDEFDVEDEAPYRGGYATAPGPVSPTAPRIPPIRGNTNPTPLSPFSDDHRYEPPNSGGASIPPPRQSMDAYGAFSDPAPSGYNDQPSPGISRTMQYADPYAAITANLHNDGGRSPVRMPTGPPSYDHTGYR